MTFTAVVTYESPSRLGPPLVYTTKSEVTLQRPDKLRVITPGDGPASEFYYDGKTMVAFAPAENLVAVAEAPPTIDAALKAAYDSAAIYFPFTDVIVADPYKDIAEGSEARLLHRPVPRGRRHDDGHGGVSPTTACSCRSGSAPRTSCRAWLRAVFRNDPSQLRHQVELSNWQLDGAVPADAFASPRRQRAMRIQFARPDPSSRGRHGSGDEPSQPKSRDEEVRRHDENDHRRLREGSVIALSCVRPRPGRTRAPTAPPRAAAGRGTPGATAAAAHPAATARGAAAATAAARPRAAMAPGTATAPMAVPRPAGTDPGTPTAPYGGTASGGDGSWHATSCLRHDGLRRVQSLLRWHLPDLPSADHREPLLRSGCYNCGGWNAAGAAAVGIAAGAAVGAASGERLRRRRPVCHGSDLSAPPGRMHVSARSRRLQLWWSLAQPGLRGERGLLSGGARPLTRPGAIGAAARAGLMHRSSDVPLHRRDDGAESRRRRRADLLSKEHRA